MDRPDFDVIVADVRIGSLVVAYRLAQAGRRVAVAEPASPRGIETLAVVTGSRIDALTQLVEDAPRIAERTVSILQPEGAVSVHFASERLGDAADAYAVVDRANVTAALLGALRDLDVSLLPPVESPLSLPARRQTGVRDAKGHEDLARCSVLSPEHVVQMTGMPVDQPVKPSSFLQATWETDAPGDGPDAVGNRVGDRAVERWFFGDPFEGSDGFARLLATEGRTALSVSMPLHDVVDRGIAIEALLGRLRRHPIIGSYLGDIALDGASLAATARVVPAQAREAPRAVGDGWVAAPDAPATAMSLLTTEVALAEATAAAIASALDRPRVTAASLATLPGLLARIASDGPSLPLGPIDAWADGLVRNPAGLVEGARALAAMFGEAG